MSYVVTKGDVPSLNFFLKALSDAMRENRTVSLDMLKLEVEEKFPQGNPWLLQAEEIFREAETRLFSYGSLQPGQQNEHMLRNISGHWLDGFVYGERLPYGWGSGMGFPVLHPDYTEQQQRVYGKLFVASGLSKHWKVLDDFEGEDYIRVLTLVYTTDPETITVAQVYAASAAVLKK